jgi:hypothetical protein
MILKRVILLALAVLLAVAIIASVLIVRSQARTAKTTPGWTTYRDPLGLYTISYPADWKANTTTSSEVYWDAYIDSNRGEHVLDATGDVVYMSYTANRYEAIQIQAVELDSGDAHAYFCKPGVPTSLTDIKPGGDDFNAGNTNIKITLGSIAFSELIPIDPTTTALTHAAASPSTYAPILGTFHSLAPAGSSC